MSWYPVDSCASLAGAQLIAISQNEALLIGGNKPAAPVKKGGKAQQLAAPAVPTPISPLLQINVLQVPSMTWKATLVNTNGHLNRQFHASVSIGHDRALIIGGLVVPSGNGQIAEDILVVSNSIFGRNVNVARRATCKLQGLSALSAIPGRDAIFLFGGCTQDKVYTSELSLYLHSDLALEGVATALLDLQVDGAKPPPRAFHTCALGGPNNDLLMVFGGQSSTGDLLNDLWVCDVSGVLGALQQAMSLLDAPGVEELKDGDEAAAQAEAPGRPKLPSVQWICLQESSVTVTPRYMHGGYSYLSIQEESDPAVPTVQFCIFGGVKSDGKNAGSELLEISLVKGDSGAYKMLGDFAAREALPVGASTRLSGAAVATMGSDSIASGCVLLFAGPTGILKVLDDKCKLAVDMRRSLAKHRPSSAPVSEESKDDGNKKKSTSMTSSSGLPKRVKYQNGNVYEGLLKRPLNQTDEDPIEPETLVRHGSGTMRYSGGEESYTGEWSDNDRCGQGTSLTFTESYEGFFAADKRHGQGALKDVQSGRVIYEGGFEEGLFSGQGTLYGQDGVYVGAFVDGQRIGHGTLTNADTGFSYTGAWLKNEIAGDGAVQDYPAPLSAAFPAGVYAGPTLDGIPSGPGGFCAFSDGSEYEGDWKSGMPNGMGRYVASNQDSFEGKWVGGRRWKGRWNSNNGIEFYDGYWDDGKPHGYGIRGYAKAGEIWEGQWKHGLRLDTNDLRNTADLREWGGK